LAGGASATSVFGVVAHPARSAAVAAASVHFFIEAPQRLSVDAVSLNSRTRGIESIHW
jgi:hypothetical protein